MDAWTNQFPAGENLHVLLWHAYSEGDHLIVASSLPSLLRVWQRVLDKHGRLAEPKRYWHHVRAASVDTDALNERLAELHHEECVESFASRVEWELRYYRDDYGALPEGAAELIDECPGFEPGGPPSECNAQFHFGCRHCDGNPLRLRNAEAWYARVKEECNDDEDFWR